MKNLIFCTAAMFVFTSLASAHTNMNPENKDVKKKQESTFKRVNNKLEALKKIDAKDINYFTRQKFNTDFGYSVKPVWNKWKDYDKATFSKGGKTYTAFFGPNSKLIGTTSVSSFASLPSHAQKFIKNKYKNYKVDGVILYDDNQNSYPGLLVDNPQFSDPDNYFVELNTKNKTIILQVDMEGFVYFFKQLD